MAARAAKVAEERDLTPFAPRRVIGQERAWAQLAHLYGTGSGPAGLILYGPAGVGKRTAAMVLAKMLLSGDAPRARRGFAWHLRAMREAGHKGGHDLMIWVFLWRNHP